MTNVLQGEQGEQGPRGEPGEGFVFKTPFGTVRATGIVSLFLILNLSFFGYIWTENNMRHQEHLEQNTIRQSQFAILICKTDLEAFIHDYPRGEIKWSELPSSIYACLPDFIYQKRIK